MNIILLILFITAPLMTQEANNLTVYRTAPEDYDDDTLFRFTVAEGELVNSLITLDTYDHVSFFKQNQKQLEVRGFDEYNGLDAEEKVACGDFSVGFAFRIRTVTAQLERVADHCTNICEQVIYLETGKIVRHRPEGWTEPELPEA